MEDVRSMELIYIDKPLFQRMFGVAVREAREAYQMTLAQVSEQTGISATRLKQIENGQRWPSRSMRTLLSNQLTLSEHRLEKMVAVARLGYIDSFAQEVKLLAQLEAEF